MKRLVFLAALAVTGIAGNAYAEPPNTHEILTNAPSGFWTSNHPAVGGAYRYRLLLLGVAIALGMGWFTWRFVKKHAR